MLRGAKREVSLGPYNPNAPRDIVMHGQLSSINANVTSQFGAIEIALSDLAGYSSQAAAWDKYRINKLELTFIPKNNIQSLAQSAVAGTAQVAPIATVLDFDDGNSLTATSEAEQYGTFKVHDPLRPFKRSYVPKVAMTVYDTGVTSGYSQPDSPVWIDVGNTGVPHYGLKWATYSNGASQTTFQGWFVFVKAWVSFAQSR